mmetsp:Transcript_30520/g.76593  ORF Transcript_30520/g.76593 Transcript_30520/m.76593 type:complete len:205 (-) Transcript_30520:176-790(-)
MAESFKNYFDESDFNEFFHFDNINLKEYKLISTDSYVESEIRKSVSKLNIKEFITIGLQLSIIGYGNGNYGKYIFEGVEKEVIDFFKNNNIKYNLKLNEKLEAHELTPLRIIRFCRYYTKNYLEKLNKGSFLFNKYCPIKSELARKNIYRGCEHIFDANTDRDLIKTLILTYNELDKRQNTNIKERIIRVLLAKGLSYEYLSKI